MAKVVALPRAWTPRLSVRAVLLVLLFCAVVFMTAYPVGRLLVNSFQVSSPGREAVWGLQGWEKAFADPSIPKALGNTFLLAAFRTGLSLILGIYFAWVVTRTNTPFRGFLEFMLWLGFFLPALPMTMGWILLLDSHYGLINRLLMNVFGLSKGPFDIYSYAGIIWAHLAFSTSIRFLLLTPAFRAMDAALEEAAQTAGSSALGVLRRITVPLLAPAILVGTALGFIKSLESFEIELLLGIPAGIFVYSTKIWDFLHWNPPLYDRATALSSLFLVVIFLMVWLQNRVLGRRQYTTITGRGYMARRTNLGRWRWVTFASSLLFIVVMILLPLSILLMGTFMRLFGFFHIEHAWTLHHWTGAFDDPVFLRSFRNTLMLGLGAALGAAVFYALISYTLVRIRFAGRGLLDFLTWLPWALPGVLIGLTLLWVFLGSGPLFKALYGTIPLLVLAIIIGGLPLGSQILKASIMQVGTELEESSRTLGASWLYTFRRVLVPLLMPAMVAVALITFVAAVRDISIVVFLSSYQSRPLSLLMLDYLVGGEMEKATVIGVFVVVLVIVAALLGRRFGLRLGPVERR